ncbi:MAG: hypothetical protein KatS3mg057_2678 [Herpetosiphonaceae bacterium]|nr:MAG: hypothetical protein KatS3mg057_2678 [Herpetosiphonaceae bacterium]
MLIYGNDHGMLSGDPIWSSDEFDETISIAWGDVDGDADLDLVAGNSNQPSRLYRNNGGALVLDTSWTPAAAPTTQVAWGDVDGDGDLDLTLGNYGQPNQIYLNTRDGRSLPGALPVVRLSRPGYTGDAAFYSSAEILTGTIAISYTLIHSDSMRVRQVIGQFSLDGGGRWFPAVPTGDTVTTNLTSAPTGITHIFKWDTFASGVMGQSDNVVFRLIAVPEHKPLANRIPGPYLYGSSVATTFPFRVRGTQVRVMYNGQPGQDALVYRLPAGQTGGGVPIADATGRPFYTDAQGYLQGRGILRPGDQLLALLPITATSAYSLYFTNATPTPLGLDSFTVAASGVQTLVVSDAHPLLLFHLIVALEWDASTDPGYLDQLVFNLQRASRYLYDFTDGQVALGDITVYQNADNWAYADLLVHATNRLRPFATIGGVVITPTADLDPTLPITYDTGQIHLGSTWNRYGIPGQNLGDDWPLILAHELAHYLLFLEDTYLGLTPDGLLTAIDSCHGSAMGDVYIPDNTEFIADASFWDAYCGNTLAAQHLQRTEWETLQLWYPALIAPASPNAGPALMPFELTRVSVQQPLTPSTTLEDPTFFLDYAGGRGQLHRGARLLTARQ